MTFEFVCEQCEARYRFGESNDNVALRADSEPPGFTQTQVSYVVRHTLSFNRTTLHRLLKVHHRNPSHHDYRDKI